MNEWIDDLSDAMAGGEPAVIVTVAGIRGSAPREPGAKMIVTAQESIGTIGGGQLEYECARIAVSMLGSTEIPSTRRFPLGSAMGQCCGGVVEILFEPIATGLPSWLAELRALHGQRTDATLVTGIGEMGGKFVVSADRIFGPNPDALDRKIVDAGRELASTRGRATLIKGHFLEAVVNSDFNIALFGAGHVGVAVADALSRLDCNIRWIDSRRNIFRGSRPNVRCIETSDAPLEVAAMPGRSYYLVMTHSHALDFEICDRILRRDDVAYCGLIGSLSKRRRFEKRFRAGGLADTAIDKLVCPIGVDGISGKKPAEIAVATAAELLQARERDALAARETLPDNVQRLQRR